jgi:hypothetical protein
LKRPGQLLNSRGKASNIHTHVFIEGEGLKSRQDQQRLLEEITDRLEYKRCEDVDAGINRHE